MGGHNRSLDLLRESEARFAQRKANTDQQFADRLRRLEIDGAAIEAASAPDSAL